MSTKITTIVANFETQLASTISIASTTGTLKAPVIDKDGVTLASGKYVMCFDLGKSNEEHLIFDLNGTTGAMSNIYSISRQGVETAGAQRQHRTGAKVTLTNFANLYYLSKVLNGQISMDATSPLFYDATPTFSSANQLVTKGYVDGIAIAGSPNASTTTKGIGKTSKQNLIRNGDFAVFPWLSAEQTQTNFYDGTPQGSYKDNKYGIRFSMSGASATGKIDNIAVNADPTMDNTNAWDKGTGVTISGGVANITNAGAMLSQNCLTVGKKYRFYVEYTDTYHGSGLKLTDRNGTGAGGFAHQYGSTDPLWTSATQDWAGNNAKGVFKGEFVAASTYFCLEGHYGAFSGTVDNFYIIEDSALKLSTKTTGQSIEAYLLANPEYQSSDTIGYFSRDIEVEPNQTYTYSFDLKTTAISGASSVGARVSFLEVTANGDGAGVQTDSTAVSTTTAWTTYTGSFTTTANTKYIHVVPLLYGHVGSATLIMDAWFRNLSLVRSANNPVFADKDDVRIPSIQEKQAMTGSYGMPSKENPFVTMAHNMMPVGGVIPYAGNRVDTVPENWTICDGRAISRTRYKSLFDVIGTTYGAGDGSTSFNVPNLKTRVVVGKDDSDSAFLNIGQTGGAKTHTLTVTEMPSHNHSVSNVFATAGFPYSYVGGNSAQMQTITTGDQGGDGAHNNLQPYITLLYIIKIK